MSKKIKALLVLLVLVLAAAGASAYAYQAERTPEYALEQLGMALEHIASIQQVSWRNLY